MKKSAKITLSAVFAALATVLMLGSYFPYLTYAVPAVAGLCTMVVFLETGTAYAFGMYGVSALLALLFAEKESAVLFVCLLGFYPIVKSFIERLKNFALEWIIKLAVFNAAAMLFYLFCSFVFGITFSELNTLFKYGAILFLLLANVTFVLYDIAVSRVALFYSVRLSPKVSKIFSK